MTAAMPEVRDRLEAELARRTVAAPEQVTRTGDRIDQAQAVQAQRIGDSLAAKTSRERMAIRAAIMRLDRGTYGLCTGCGAEIAPSRLEAIPWAAMCIPCQQEMEATA